jgi:homoserine kinase
LSHKLKPVRVRVPASTSNLGPCFDLCGLAVGLYVNIEIAPSAHSSAVELVSQGEGADVLTRIADNLAVTTVQKVWERAGIEPIAVRMTIHNSIPLFSGLGSSGAAVAGTMIAVARMAGLEWSMEDFLTLGTEIEGHPDNVTASLLGGLVLSSTVNGRVHSTVYHYPHPIEFVVMYPRIHVPTKDSRKLLPENYPAGDAVFNVSRAAQLAAAFASGRLPEIGFAFEDKMHQPYRQATLPHLEKSVEAAQSAGAWGAFLSGSGPSVGALCSPEQGEAVEKAFQKVLMEMGVEGRTWRLPIDKEGVEILS